GRGADATRVYEDALERDPRSVELRQRLVQVALGDPAQAAPRARELLRADRPRESRLLAVQALPAPRQPGEAARLPDARPPREPDVFALQLELADAYSKAGQEAAARARLDRLDWGHDVRLLARLHEVRAAVEQRAGNTHQQQWELEQAARLREQ